MSDANSASSGEGGPEGGAPDRRRFLTGAAAGAAAIAAGGLVAGGPAQAAVAPAGRPVLGGFEYRSGLRYIHGYGYADLPFPTDPGAFLAQALKTVFGAFQRCLCVTPDAVLDFAGLGGGVEHCSMKGGVGVGIGGGQLIQQILSVVLNPTEHISQGVNGVLGDIGISHDASRPAPPSLLLPIDVDRIIQKFTVFANPVNWPKYIAEFATNPLNIFNEFLGLFFPAKQTMNFNIEVRCSKFPGVTLINCKPIPMENPSLTAFPPAGAGYAPRGEVELCDKNDPSGKPLVVIKEFRATVTHGKDLPPQVIAGTDYPPCSVDRAAKCGEGERP